MKNNNSSTYLKGEFTMAVNDMIEIISSSNPDIYGKVGTIKDIKSSPEGVDLRVETKDGLEFWIDAEDVVSY